MRVICPYVLDESAGATGLSGVGAVPERPYLNLVGNALRQLQYIVIAAAERIAAFVINDDPAVWREPVRQSVETFLPMPTSHAAN
jgi:hypothetical protein